MLENVLFFLTKREKNHLVINIESGGGGGGGGENLLGVSPLLSGIVRRKAKDLSESPI